MASVDVNPQTSVLDAFQVELLAGLQPYGDEIKVAAGDPLFRRGETSDAFFVIDSGEVRLEGHSDELDTDAVLDYVGPVSFLGEVSMLAGLAGAVAARAEELARRTVEETHIGNVQDKVLKIGMASTAIHQSIVGQTGYGPMRDIEDRLVTEIASPVGVIVGLVPVTNPVPT